MTLLGLVRLSPIRKSACNGDNYTFDLLDGFLFLWRLSLTSLLLVSLCALAFYCSFVYFLVPMLLLLMSSRSCSCFVVWLFNKLG